MTQSHDTLDALLLVRLNVAAFSEKERAAQPALVMLGNMTIRGNIVAARSL